MTEIHTRILVGPDHRISGTAPAIVLPGDHEVTIDVKSLPRQPLTTTFDVDAAPVHHLGPWPEVLSLRREDMYDEDGR
jgi:hypothetical protein